jgi:magnesium transporter
MRKKRKLIPDLLRLTRPQSTKRERKLGEAPGTVTYLGNRAGIPTKVYTLTYSDTEIASAEVQDMESLGMPMGPDHTQWVNIIGLSDEAQISALGKITGLSNLVVEDIVNPEQRPKVDEYPDYIFVVLKMLYPDGSAKIIREHVAMVLKQGRVFVYQEVEADVFEGVRVRIEKHSGRIRTRGSDYLLFALIDALIDNYFLILEMIDGQIDQLEAEIYSNPSAETAAKIQQLRKDVITIRRWMAPGRELITRLIESESELISRDTKLFLRDALDHATEITETLHIQREMAFSLMEIYMSNVSNKMNEVMKVLTIIATIFIPLTFIAGIYGMNFRNMPELEWEYGYFGILGIMVVVVIGLIRFFRTRGWL